MPEPRQQVHTPGLLVVLPVGPRPQLDEIPNAVPAIDACEPQSAQGTQGIHETPEAATEALDGLGVPTPKRAHTRTRERPSLPWVMCESHNLPKDLLGPRMPPGPIQMPRHAPLPLDADARLNRPHMDALPTHRRCVDCLAVLPLDAQHFYENRTRYPWNLGRFRNRCRPCDCKDASDRTKLRRDQRNARDRERRAEYRALQAKGGLMLHLTLKDAAAAKRIAKVERATHLALYRRRVRRADRQRGPYVDPVKKMIRLRQEEYARRQGEALEDVERASAFRTALSAQDGLAALRKLHRAQHARRLHSE